MRRMRERRSFLPILWSFCVANIQTAHVFVYAFHATFIHQSQSASQLKYTNSHSHSHSIASQEDASAVHVETAFAASDDDDDDDENAIKLVPLSLEPMLLVSSRPLLTTDECDTLRRHFQQEQSKEGAVLLQRVYQQIDHLTACPSHDGESPQPRFLLYPPHQDQEETSSSSATLLPDGLHVDTNNGMHFRHLTALLYLTTNDSGATTFPLAKRITRGICRNDYCPHEKSENYARLVHAAQALIESGVTHTLNNGQSDENQTFSKLLHEASEQLFSLNSSPLHFVDDNHRGHTTLPGLRVLPRGGMMCLFSNVLETGDADPFSFHGGETCYDHDAKALLAFFKEVPIEKFSSRREFGQRVAETRRHLVTRYYRYKDHSHELDR